MTVEANEVEDLNGRVIAGRYKVEAQIGRGGMGTVYRARQLGVDRVVALKVIRDEFVGDEKIIKRFLREMRATARVEHPNTVRLYDFGREDGMLFLAMEHLEGRTLARELRIEKTLSPRRAALLAAQIARGLAASHHEGIIHRDLKPQNIMLVHKYGERDQVKVLDFGIARFTEAEHPRERERLTTQGMIMGTPEYLAPEMVVPGPLDHRADLYSLGVVLYQMVTGVLPFTDKAAVTVMFRHVHEAPEPPSHRLRSLPPWIDTVVLRLLEKKPDDRYADCNEAADILERFARTEPEEIAPIEPEKPRRPSEIPTLILQEPLTLDAPERALGGVVLVALVALLCGALVTGLALLAAW